MKKEHLIGGFLGIVLFGLIAYAATVFIGVRNRETEQLVQQPSVQPLPLEIALPEARQPAIDQLPRHNDHPEERSTAEPQPAAGTAAETGKKDESGKTAGNANEPAQSGNGRLSGSLTPEQIKRLDQIDLRKTELNVEREKLTKEREQLFQEIRDAGTVRKKEQLEDIRSRQADLGERIKKFNEEVNSINEEAKNIIGPPKK